MPRILIIDDEKAIRNTLKEILEFESYSVDQAEDGPAGLDLLIQHKYDLVLCDIKMPKMDGLEVLSRAQGAGPRHGLHHGVGPRQHRNRRGGHQEEEPTTSCTKPPDLNRLLVTVRNALDRTKLVTETKTLKKKLSVTKGSAMVGTSAALGAVRKAIEKVAPTDARVLITGPNGAGKEMVARQLHDLSPRAQGPMVEVNCAAIPSELIESELFGHEKGSFTSAVKQRIGKFEQADGGTLFLDEIGDMSLSAQAKVLRALQESKITRVGGEKEISVNVRVLAATNKDLLQEIADKQLPRRPLPPPFGHPHPGAGPQRPPRGHPRPHPEVPGRHRRRLRQQAQENRRRGPKIPASAGLARQHPRTAQRGRAPRHHERRHRDGSRRQGLCG